jgi:protein-S-isoprenylcysteine O-methyltransferase Ste14
MRKASAAVGSTIFFVVAPTMVAGVIPWRMTNWRVLHPLPFGWVQQLVGWMLVGLGASVLLHAFTRFVIEGFGTPAPIAPTERLVVGGLYRYVRNPMYLAVLSVVFGQAIALGQPSLAAYGLLLFVAFACFVRLYEEPTLARQFGPEYTEYVRAVPRWWPRRPRGGMSVTDDGRTRDRRGAP